MIQGYFAHLSNYATDGSRATLDAGQGHTNDKQQKLGKSARVTEGSEA